MTIEVFGPKTIPASRLRRLGRRVIEAERGDKPALNLVFVTNRFIRRLNRRHLNKDKPTNVLAFPGEGNFLGEIYISVDYAKKEAKEIGIGFLTEIDRLVIPGLLHLLGYTHRAMRTKEGLYLGAVTIRGKFTSGRHRTKC